MYHLHDPSNLARNPIPSPLTFRTRRPSLHFQRTGPRFGPSQVLGRKFAAKFLYPEAKPTVPLHATVGMCVVAYWLLLRMEREREMFEGRCVGGWFSLGLVSCVLYRGVYPIRKRLVRCKMGGLEGRVGTGMGIVLGPVGFWIAGLRGPSMEDTETCFWRKGWLNQGYRHETVQKRTLLRSPRT